MKDSDRNCPHATASVTVFASSASLLESSPSSPSKGESKHHNQPANAAKSPLRTAAKSSVTAKRSFDLTASEIADFWKGEKTFHYLFFRSFFLSLWIERCHLVLRITFSFSLSLARALSLCLSHPPPPPPPHRSGHCEPQIEAGKAGSGSLSRRRPRPFSPPTSRVGDARVESRI